MGMDRKTEILLVVLLLINGGLAYYNYTQEKCRLNVKKAMKIASNQKP